MIIALILLQAAVGVMLIARGGWGPEYSLLLLGFGLLNVYLGTQFVKGED